MIPQSIGLVTNVYKEENALPGLLENASKFFDEIVVVSAPPEGGNNDDTIDIGKKWGARIEHDTIEDGFGSLRTRCLRYSQCEWVVIMDADERIQWDAREMLCLGDESWDPNTCPNPALGVQYKGAYDFGHMFRQVIANCPRLPESEYSEQRNAIQFSRRHWFDFKGINPTQNWHIIPDWQLRCVRNLENIHYIRGMHEGIVDDLLDGNMPTALGFNQNKETGFYFDHYHLFFKPMEFEQRNEDIEIYNRLHQIVDGHDSPQEPEQ